MVLARRTCSMRDKQEVVCTLSNGDIAYELKLSDPNHPQNYPYFHLLDLLSYLWNG